MLRIGFGYDSHRFIADRSLILGGVTIPYEKGMAAHSDGDVLLHAICDALLGAAALGDIGQHFPNIEEFKNSDSRVLLKKVFDLVSEKNFSINNIDATILADQPKFLPYIREMRQNIANDLQLELDQVSIKATTNEGMGFIGRGEGITVQAIALMESLLIGSSENI